MEYLITYGWAILAIVVVLGMLYALGVFNPSNFAPKAQPGSCTVNRPYGAGTTAYLSLQGTCNGELPRYVAQLNGNSYVRINMSDLPKGANPVTVTMWFYYNNNPDIMLLAYGSNNTACGGGNYFSFRLGVDCGNPTIESDPWCNQVCAPVPGGTSKGTWYFAALTSNSTGQTVYGGVDGQLYRGSGGVPSNIISTGYMYIGKGKDGSNLVGGVSNVQVYNTSLTANEVQTIYQEGIGGAPIMLDNLIGWYPLNGNTRDYSGNSHGSVTSEISYSGTWSSNYYAP